MEENTANKLQSRTIIKCPHCGGEYLPGEILYPDYVVGQPKRVIRDGLGHIIYEEWKDDYAPLATEKYVCDHCNKPFVVNVSLHVESKPEEEELDFSEEYVSLL